MKFTVAILTILSVASAFAQSPNENACSRTVEAAAVKVYMKNWNSDGDDLVVKVIPPESPHEDTYGVMIKEFVTVGDDDGWQNVDHDVKVKALSNEQCSVEAVEELSGQ
jgi:hypothetical protein